MVTITRKGLYLSADNIIIPSQGSSDVKVSYNNDTESYQDYLIEPRIGYYVNGCPKSVVCKYSIDTKMIIIPKEAFNQNGVLVIAIALIDNNDSNHIEVTKPISFEVSKAPNEAIVLPDDDTWQTAVDNLVEQLFNKDYAPQFNEALNEINEAVNTANTASQNASNALDKSNETNQLINGKIEDGSFIPDISMTAVSGDTTSIERTGTKEAPVFNLTVEKGKDGEGQTTIKKDDVIQQELVLSTQRTSKPTYVKVQMKDNAGNPLSVESTLDNVFIKTKDGIAEKSTQDLITLIYNLAKNGLYLESPKAIFDEVDKFI